MPNRKKSGQWLVACKTRQSFLFLLDFCFTSFISLKKFDFLEGDFSRNQKAAGWHSLKQKQLAPKKHQCLEDESSPLFCCLFRHFVVVVVGIFVTKKSKPDAWNPAGMGDICGACYEAPHETGGQKNNRFEFFFMRLISMKFIGI